MKDTAKYIEEEVEEYKKETYDLLDYAKILFFTSLLSGIAYSEFEKKLKEQFKTYQINTIKRQNKSIKEIDEIIKGINDIFTPIGLKLPEKELLEAMKFKLDTTSIQKAENYYFKVIKNYYNSAAKTLKKEYVNKEAYLSKKVNQYAKVEKVIPYYSKNTKKVVRYNDIATYNSMVYNVNLTSSAWNSTIDSSIKNGNDLVYVDAHPYACPLCQEWQGKIYSLSGQDLRYPSLESALNGGLKHPNCKHSILEYWGQTPTSEYSTREWEDKYEARQKKQALELEKSRTKTDIKIYKELGNQEEVDKLNQKIKTLNQAIREQKDLM